jgi:hypothetical protein
MAKSTMYAPTTIVPRSATSERPNTNQVRRAPVASDAIPKIRMRPE